MGKCRPLADMVHGKPERAVLRPADASIHGRDVVSRRGQEYGGGCFKEGGGTQP